MAETERENSGSADHIGYITVTIEGVKDVEGARQLFAAMSGQKSGEPDTLSVEISQISDQVFSGSFPICCWHSSDESYWGVCRYGVPGPCQPENVGCPA